MKGKKTSPCMETLVKVCPFIRKEDRLNLILATLKLERLLKEVKKTK